MAGLRTYIRTFTGVRIEPLQPDPSLINIQDIAAALSKVARYTGHTAGDLGYSVAQHSVMVADRLPGTSWELWALLHDATEAYIADIAKPIKHTPEFAEYRRIERRLMDAVCARFHLPLEEPAAVKDADQRMLATEMRDLMARNEPWPFEPYDYIDLRPSWRDRFGFGRIWTPRKARRLFLKRYYELHARQLDALYYSDVGCM